MSRLDGIREYSRGALWVVPAVSMVLALVAGTLLSGIEVDPHMPLAFQGTADDARTLLIGITSTMVTVIALLLGLAVVALQLSSTQFSPRLLRNFLRDRPNQLVLGAFVATFAYSAAGLFTVGVSGGERSDQFPRLAVTVAMVLLFVSLGLLVFFAHHLLHSIQVDTIMLVVERETLAMIHRLPPATTEPLPEPPPDPVEVPATCSGYVQFVRLDRLLAVAAAHGVHVRLCPSVGEHVVAGTPLAVVWSVAPGARDALPTAALNAVVRIGHERTLEQDPALGIRQLVDAACKALSPAINDPYTAVQAIDHLAVLFAGLAECPPGPYLVRDPGSGATVTLPGRTMSDYLSKTVGLIRRYGAGEPTVVQALLRLLKATALLAPGAEPAACVRGETELLLAAAELRVAQPEDLDVLRAEATALLAVTGRGVLTPRPASPSPAAGTSPGGR